jgi:hypothetical protein
LYSAKLSFIIEGKITNAHYKQKLREFMTNNPAVQVILNGILYTEEKVNTTMRMW